jgi:hypothetical protein
MRIEIYAHTIAASHREAVEAVEGRVFSNVLELPAGLETAIPGSISNATAVDQACRAPAWP